jgi:hypothetical protein
MRRWWASGPALALPALLLLAGCESTVQETFGIGRQAPDEFQVVRRQPLIIPPDSTLRPPRPGVPGPQEASSSAQAREVLTGTPATATDTTMSSAETALLAEAKGPADPNIRQVLLEEDTELTTIDESRFLIILDWQRQRMTPQGTPINAAAEAERLRQEGVRVTGPVTVRTGSTPLPPSGSGS